MVFAAWPPTSSISPVAISVRFPEVEFLSDPLTHFHCFSNLHTRKELREQSWKIDGWAETVYKVKDSHHLMFQGQFNLRQQSSHFTKYQDSLILEALPFSTLK